MDCDAAVHASDFKRCKVYQGCNQVKLSKLTFLFLCSFTDYETCYNEIKINFVWLRESFNMLLYALKSAKLFSAWPPLSVQFTYLSILDVFYLFYVFFNPEVLSSENDKGTFNLTCNCTLITL